MDSVDEGLAPLAVGDELSEELLPEPVGSETTLPAEAVPTTRILSADGEDAIVSGEENQLDETLEPLSETVSLTEEPLSVSGSESIALPAEAVPRTRIFSARIFSGGEELVSEGNGDGAELSDGELRDFDAPIAQAEEVSIPEEALPTTITMSPESIIPSVRSEGVLIAQAVPNDIVSDGTLGSMEPIDAVIQGSPASLIRGGTPRGSNLFHSFESFSVGDGQRVYFADPDGIENILSRVTGGKISTINGLLGVEGVEGGDGTANLFLFNRNGITFGSGAELDIRGSFTASTGSDYRSINNQGDTKNVNIQGTDFLTISVPLGPQLNVSRNTSPPPSFGTITSTGILRTGGDLTLSANSLDLTGQLIAGEELSLQAAPAEPTQTATNGNGASPSELNLSANESILLGGNIISTNNPVNVTLTSDQDSVGAGGTIILRQAQILSNGGDITLRGGNESLNGITLDNITSPSAITNVLEEGASYNTENNGQPSFAPETLARNIFTRGICNDICRDLSKQNPDRSESSPDRSRIDGIGLDGATIDAGVDGNILLLGGGSDAGYGILIATGSTIKTSGSGNIRLVGLGGLGSDNQIGNDTFGRTSGILLTGAGSSISSEDGDIQLTGYAAGFDQDFDPFTNGKVDLSKVWADVGVWIRTDVFSSGSGDIYVTGISDARSSFNNEGIAASTGSSIRAEDTGNINLHGIGGLGEDSNTNPGIHISSTVSLKGSRVVAENGDINLIGVGRATGRENYGVQLNARGQVIAGENVIITGIGGPESETSNNRVEGIFVDSSSKIESEGGGGNTISFIADEITLQGENVVTGIGDVLQLQPNRADLDIFIGGAVESNIVTNIGRKVEDQLHLSINDLDSLGNDFSKILIGNPTVPVIRVVRDESFQDSVFQDPVELRANVIDTLGDSADQKTNESILRDATILGIDDASVSLIADRNIYSPNIIAPGQSVRLESINKQGNIFIRSHSIFARPIGNQDGNVTILGNSLTMENGAIDTINAETRNSNNSSSIKIDVTDSVSLLDSNILSLTNGPANANDIEIMAGGNVLLRGLSSINTVSIASNASGTESGNGGNIQISANSLNLENGGQLSASTFSDGNAGNIILENIEEEIYISGETKSANFIESNNINLSNEFLDDLIILPNDDVVSSDDILPGKLDDSEISILNETTRIEVPEDNSSARYYKLDVSRPGIAAVFRFDRIFSDSDPLPSIEGSPRGKVKTTSTNTSLEIFNNQGQSLFSDIGVPDSLESNGYIFFEKPGDYFIRISTNQQTSVFNRVNDTEFDFTETLATQSSLDLNKIDGNPILQVSLIDTSFQNTSGLFSTTSSNGNGGDIELTANQLEIINNGEISASTSGTGAGGSIILNTDEISLDDGGRITASTSNAGSGGSIILNPIDDRLTINGDGEISASTSGTGAGGSITIRDADVVTLNNAQLLTSSTSSSEADSTDGTNTPGSAGNVQIDDVGILFMRQGSLIQAAAEGGADGGNVDIDADFVITVPSEDNDILANATGGGNGGRIDIDANRIIGFRVVEEFRDNLRGNGRSDISASAGDDGIDGEVNLNNFLVDPNQGLNELPETVEDPSDRIAQGCRADLSGDSSTGNFAITGRSGQPLNPANIASDTSTLDDLGPVDAQAESSPSSPENVIATNTPPQVIEDAQKAIRTDSGEIRLVAQGPWHSSVSCSDLH
ncbi:MAG: filamentous hemagglutinin N-terminal domain-containing protein [Cyanobacteria bacterium J06656_5]